MNFSIILSGGVGTRMKLGDFPKQYVEINSKPILVYTLEKFQISNDIDHIIIVAADTWKDKILEWKEKYNFTKILSIAKPGDTRQESILSGLEECIKNSISKDDKCIIHDGVRPLVRLDTINECMNKLNEFDGCMPVLGVNDTIYQSDNGQCISSLLDRNTLFAGQSPEAFVLHKYYEINKNASKDELSNTRGSSEIAFKNNLKVAMIEGDEFNFKLTTPSDMERFRMIIGEKNESI